MSSKPVVVLIPGDLHLTAPGLPHHSIAQWVVDEANTLIRPDFVQFIGDNVQDATPEQFALFRELTAQVQAPWHALVGDHADATVPGVHCATGFGWPLPARHSSDKNWTFADALPRCSLEMRCVAPPKSGSCGRPDGAGAAAHQPHRSGC